MKTESLFFKAQFSIFKWDFVPMNLESSLHESQRDIRFIFAPTKGNKISDETSSPWTWSRGCLQFKIIYPASLSISWDSRRGPATATTMTVAMAMTTMMMTMVMIKIMTMMMVDSDVSNHVRSRKTYLRREREREREKERERERTCKVQDNTHLLLLGR